MNSHHTGRYIELLEGTVDLLQLKVEYLSRLADAVGETKDECEKGIRELDGMLNVKSEKLAELKDCSLRSKF